MKRKEFLLEKFYEFKEKNKNKQIKFNENPAIVRIEPFKVADNLYYIGDKKVCIHLIETSDGLIVIDSGYLGTAHILVDSIWRAGFDPKNVRWILHTHGHYDHFGASCEFKNMYGTKLAISRIDAESLREKPSRAHIDEKAFPFAKIPEFDREIEDGEIFALGDVKIRCVLTPGHTAGVLSLFFNVIYDGNTYLAGLFGGAGVNAISLPFMCYNEDPEDCPEQMLKSIEKIWDEPVVIHLGNHPHNNKTIEKREQQLKEGGNPFVAPDSWHDFLSELRVKVEAKIKENEALEKEILLKKRRITRRKILATIVVLLIAIIYLGGIVLWFNPNLNKFKLKEVEKNAVQYINKTYPEFKIENISVHHEWKFNRYVVDYDDGNGDNRTVIFDGTGEEICLDEYIESKYYEIVREYESDIEQKVNNILLGIVDEKNIYYIIIKDTNAYWKEREIALEGLDISHDTVQCSIGLTTEEENPSSAEFAILSKEIFDAISASELPIEGLCIHQQNSPGSRFDINCPSDMSEMSIEEIYQLVED